MVSQKKKDDLKRLKAELKEWPVIGILNMIKLPGKQLYQMKQKLKGQAKITMYKKRLIFKALKESGLEGIDSFEQHIQGVPALLLTKENPFKLARIIQESKSPAAAKEGDIAPRDIVIPAGPTNLMAGPVIGELQRAKIPASVEGGKIAVKSDTVVAKEGDPIQKGVADILSKLGVEPMEIGLTLLAVWEEGYVYPKNILFIPPEKYLDDLKLAASRAMNLTINTEYYTPLNIELFLAHAHREAFNLAVEANLLTAETLEPLLAKAYRQALALKEKVKEPAEAPKEEPKAEERPAEEAKEAPAEEKKEEAKEEEKPEEKKEEAKSEEKKEEAKE